MIRGIRFIYLFRHFNLTPVRNLDCTSSLQPTPVLLHFCLYAKYFTLLISKMYLTRVLSFIGNVRFNVRGEHVPGCLGRG